MKNLILITMLFFSVLACEKTEPLQIIQDSATYLENQNNEMEFKFDNKLHFTGFENGIVIFEGSYFLDANRMVVNEFVNYTDESKRFLFDWEENIYLRYKNNLLIFTNNKDCKYFIKN